MICQNVMWKRTVSIWDICASGHKQLNLSMFSCVCLSLSSDMSSEGVYPSLFMSALSSQSDRTLSLCWEQHCKLLPGVQGIHASQVASWSVEEVNKPYVLTHIFIYCLSLAFRTCSDYLKPDVIVLQVFRFVQNLIGCEDQARVFKEEVRPPSACERNNRFIPTMAAHIFILWP